MFSPLYLSSSQHSRSFCYQNKKKLNISNEFIYLFLLVWSYLELLFIKHIQVYLIIHIHVVLIS